MANALSIRAARPADTDAIFALIRALAVYEKLEHMVSGDVESLRESLFGAIPHCRALVAERDGEIVGFALYFTTYSSFLTRPGVYLEDLFVQPADRGLGIGRGLLTALARVAAEMGAGRLEWRVLDWNAPSIAFYRNLGATILPEWQLVRMTGAEIAALAHSDTRS